MSELLTISPEQASASLLRRLNDEQSEVWSCFQCGRCSSGCPVSTFFDLLPMEVIRLAAYGMEEPLMNCHTIWLCASCETCSTRCPNGIDIAGTMDILRQWCLSKGFAAAEPRIAAFHKSFLNSVRRGGRTHELGMIGEYKMRSGDLFGDFKLGLRMFGKGKLRILPKSIKGKDEVRKIFQRSMREE